MSRFFTLIILILITVSANAQQPVFDWAGAFLNAGDNSIYRDNSNGRTVAVDKSGNVYSAGLFQYTVDFDPGPGVHTLTAANLSETAIYISKLDANGNFVWAEQLPVLVEFGTIEMKVDGQGNVYLVSDFEEEADMDPGPGVYMMSPTGFRDAFVIKLDTNGNLVWVKQFGGPGDTGPRGSAIDIDNSGNVIICGLFNNTVDFDPGPGTFNLTSSAHMQSFIVKLNSNGNFLWALQFGNSPVVYQGSVINDVKCDKDGNICTTGTFDGNCDFDPGPSLYDLQGRSIDDSYISKLDSNGNFVWAKRIGIADSNYYQYIQPRGVDIDSKGNVITTGYFHGNFDFDPGAGVYLVSNSHEGIGEGYVLELNSSGDLSWVKKIDSPEGGEKQRPRH